MVCAFILEDDSGTNDPVSIESQERHPALDNPLMSQFLRYVERWVSVESLGADSAQEFAHLRSMAIRIFGP